MKFSHIIVFFAVIVAVHATAATSVQCLEGSCPGDCMCSEAKICVDAKVAKDGANECKTKYSCVSGGKSSTAACGQCLQKAGLDSVTACLKAASSINSTSTNITESNPITIKTNNKGQASCVSTAWIQEHKLEHATLGSSHFAKVLCVPGDKIPCGTPGHLLRSGQQGSLMTYREVCEIRADCIESSMLVSKLSHSFDWSRFKNANGLELTSVSACPTSTPISPSRIVAVLADGLNRNGMGAICNFISELPSSVIDATMKFTAGK